MRSRLPALILFFAAAPACAQEVFGGAFVHDVATPITKSGQENGVDIHLGWRGERIRALSVIGSPSPYVFGSVNTAGDTNFLAAGLSWKIGDRIYARPGIALAVHDGPGDFQAPPDRIDFGSPILFELEAAVGVRLDPRWSAEASWVHLSHGTLFSPHNPGSDNFGVRLNYRY
jgi:hypothetical protein